MEAFESFVALTLEVEGLVVSEAVKFPITRQTKKAAYEETQTHGFEVDLIGARADKLVLATVKSFFGSQGVRADAVMNQHATPAFNRLYALLNDPAVREGVVAAACERYGYQAHQLELRLYAGKFAGAKAGDHEARIRQWCSKQVVGSGPIRVFNVREVTATARRVAESKTYRDNAALVAIKVLAAAGMLSQQPASAEIRP
jgi:hypothetical protein